MRAAISVRLVLVTITLLFAAAMPSSARPKSKDWQTGKLVSRKTLVPTDTKAKSGRCLFPPILYTVETSNYKYQFIGYQFSFYSTLPTITFRIDSHDGTIHVRDPKSGRVVELNLFGKLAGATYNRSPVLPRKAKRRDWMTAEVTAALPFMVDLLLPALSALKPNTLLPFCGSAAAYWKYTIEAQGKSHIFLWRDRRPLDVTVGGVSEIALAKNGSAYLIDDDGKERKVQLMAASKNP